MASGYRDRSRWPGIPMAMGELTPLAWLLLAGAILSALLFVMFSDDEVWDDDEDPTLDTRGPDDR